MKNTLINISDLWFSYDDTVVLQDVNLNISEGDFLALVGPNGGGKTTLLKLISGLLTPDRGVVSIQGQSSVQGGEGLGYVPQNISRSKAFPISVYDVVLMGRLNVNRCYCRLYYNQRDHELTENLLEKVGIWKYRYRRMDSLSGGQQQRALIARALMASPKILILDEPTASLDMQGRTELYTLLRQISRNVAVVMASHDVKTIGQYIKSVLWVNRRVQFHDTPSLMTNNMDGPNGLQMPLCVSVGT